MNRVYSDEIKSFDLPTKDKDPNHIFDKKAEDPKTERTLKIAFLILRFY